MIGEREYNFGVEMWLPKKPTFRPLRVALATLAVVGVSYGMKVGFETLNAHFDSVQSSETARLRKIDLDRLSEYDNYGGWTMPKVESPDDVWGTPQWERPTDWERKIQR